MAQQQMERNWRRKTRGLQLQHDSLPRENRGEKDPAREAQASSENANPGQENSVEAPTTRIQQRLTFAQKGAAILLSAIRVLAEQQRCQSSVSNDS